MVDAGETDGSGGSDTSSGTDTGGDDATDGGDTSGSGGGGESGGVSDDDSDGDGLPDDRDPQPSVDNSDDLARYKWVKERVSWAEAKALAAAEGGYLASISSQFENDLIYAVVSDGFDENSYLTLVSRRMAVAQRMSILGAQIKPAKGRLFGRVVSRLSMRIGGRPSPIISTMFRMLWVWPLKHGPSARVPLMPLA